MQPPSKLSPAQQQNPIIPADTYLPPILTELSLNDSRLKFTCFETKLDPNNSSHFSGANFETISEVIENQKKLPNSASFHLIQISLQFKDPILLQVFF